MRNAVMGVLAFVVFGAAGFFVYRNLKGSDPMPDLLEGPGVCIACKQEVTAKHKAMEPEPLQCPACDERAVFKWYYCNDCHKRFVPRPELHESGVVMLPMRPKCTSCACEDVTNFISGFLNQHPVGDAALPKWPVTANGNNGK